MIMVLRCTRCGNTVEVNKYKTEAEYIKALDEKEFYFHKCGGSAVGVLNLVGFLLENEE